MNISTANDTATSDSPDDLPELATEELARAIAMMAAEKKAENIVALRVRELVQYTDYFVICSGRSDRQVAAIREHLQREVRNSLDLRATSVEGGGTNQWVILDYGDVVVHVFFEPVREYYQLERLWSDAPLVELDLPEPVRRDPYSN